MPCAVILTALPAEYTAVRAYITNPQKKTHEKGTIYEWGQFAGNGQTWDVGIVEIGAGNSGAGREAERAITYFKPNVILFVGVAGGIKDKDVSLGDVVASTKVYGYESGKAGETFQPRPAIGLAAYRLENRARSERRTGEWFQRISVTEPVPRVFVAPIAAGEKVIASTKSDVYNFLRSNYGDAVAVEMEGFGFLEAAWANDDVSAMVIRGISDLIDGKADSDKEGSQEIASRNASAFAFQLLSEFKPRDTSSENEQERQDDNSIFIGREAAIKDIDDRTEQQRAKIIVIQAEGGTGKTTLAEQYFKEKGYNKLLEISMSKSISAEKVIEKWLKCLGYNLKQLSDLDFEDKLDLLSENIKNNKIGILIDNLELALNQEGQFLNQHDCYVHLLRALANSSKQSLTLIASRQTLNERIDKMNNYHLEGLSVETWQKFFEYLNIKIDLNSIALCEINQAWAGNAKAMQFLGSEIEEFYEYNLNQYWQDNEQDLLGKQYLKDLVVSQFERVKELNLDAYRLLCSLGCYRYPLPEKFLLSLLEPISKLEKKKTINYLRDCSLVEFKNKQYFLHPVIRVEACERLQLSREWEKETNKKAAIIYHENTGNFTNLNQISTAFEAIYHYQEAEEFDECYRILMNVLDAENNLENLRCSENLWLYTSKLVEECIKISNSLSGLKKAIILIPLGILYPEVGKNREAVTISKTILHITEELRKHEPNNHSIIFAQISAHLISGRANRLIGNFTEALRSCEDAIKVIKSAHKTIDKSILDLDYCKALAWYERGTVHLERAKLRGSSLEAGLASSYIVFAGFSAIKEKIPQKIGDFLRNSENEALKESGDIVDLTNEVPKELEYIFDYYDGQKPDTSRDNDYTKKIRIAHNIGKCLKLMNLTATSRAVLNLALKILPETDNLNRTWSYVELASCALTDDEAEEYYSQALNKIDSLEYLCRTYVLFEYGNFKYSQGYYLKAIDKYLKLEKLLEKTEFESLRARNYYSICLAYSNLSIDDKIIVEGNIIIDCRKTAGGNIYRRLKESEDICKELNLPFINKIGELRKILQSQSYPKEV